MSVETTPLADNTFLLIRAEPTWAQWGTAKTTVAVPYYGGNFGLRPDDPDRIQPHVDGDDETTFVVQDTRDVTGPIEIGLFPSLAKRLLDWAVLRSGSPKKGKSYTTKLIYPGLFVRVCYGVMVNTMTIDFSDGDDVRLTLECQGQYETLLQGASIPVIGSYSFPGKTSITFLNSRFLWSLNNLVTEIVPVGLESGQITYSNNLVIGPHVEDRINTEKDGTIEYLREGQREVSGNVVALVDRVDLPLMTQNKYNFSLKLLCAHRDGTYSTVVTGSVAGNLKTVIVADGTQFAQGDVVRFDTAVKANRCIGTITLVAVNTLTIDVLDKDVATGDYVFNDAVEMEIASARVTSIDYSHEPGDLVKATINFRGLAETSGAILFAYKAKAYVE